MNTLRRLYWVMDTIREHWWLQRELPIRPTDLVLDVGSGASPHFRSNVLCDKFVHDAAERHGEGLRTDRPFVVADVQGLPFASGSFDFVICSHVLEHVEDPSAAVSELTRVGRRGYIETPSAEWERLAGFPFHRWLVSVDNGTLKFTRKSRPVEDPEMRDWFERMQQQLRLRGYIWWRRRAIGTYTWLLWEGRVPVEIHDWPVDDDAFTRAELVDQPAGSYAPPAPLGRFDRLLDAYGRVVRGQSQPTWLEFDRFLRCPRCAGSLTRRTDRFDCAGCGHRYPIDADGRPWLLAD